MKKNCFILLALLFISPLFGLDVYLNGQFYNRYQRDELIALALPVQTEEARELPLLDILPLMENIYYLEGESGDRRLLWEDIDINEQIGNMKLFMDGETIALEGDGNRLSDLTKINIHGIPAEKRPLLIWIPVSIPGMTEEIETFARLHQLEIRIEMIDDPWDAIHLPRNQSEQPSLIITENKDLHLWQDLELVGNQGLSESIEQTVLLPDDINRWYTPLVYRFPVFATEERKAGEDNPEKPLFADFYDATWLDLTLSPLWQSRTPITSRKGMDFIRESIRKTKENLENGTYIQTTGFQESSGIRLYMTAAGSAGLQDLAIISYREIFNTEESYPVPLEAFVSIVPEQAPQTALSLQLFLKRSLLRYGDSSSPEFHQYRSFQDFSDDSALSASGQGILSIGSPEFAELQKVYSSLARLYYNDQITLEELMEKLFPKENR